MNSIRVKLSMMMFLELVIYGPGCRFSVFISATST